jgi:PAS domain S-box-containing protein
MIRHPEATALQSARGAFLALGDDGLVAYANPEALRLLGWDHNLIGKPLRAIVPEELRNRQSQAYEAFVVTRRVTSYPKVQPAKGQDGSLRQVYVSVAAFERPDGSLFLCSALGEPRAGLPDVQGLARALAEAGYQRLSNMPMQAYPVRDHPHPSHHPPATDL